MRKSDLIEAIEAHINDGYHSLAVRLMDYMTNQDLIDFAWAEYDLDLEENEGGE
jgi:hypothetical protein